MYVVAFVQGSMLLLQHVLMGHAVRAVRKLTQNYHYHQESLHLRFWAQLFKALLG